MNARDKLAYALYASIAAFLIIEGLLVEVMLEGVFSPYQGISKYFMGSLIPIGVVAYLGYLGWLEKGRNVFKYVSLLALILGSISIIRGVYGYWDALPILFAAYLTEVVVGPYLMDGFSKIDVLSSRLFIIGISIFVFSLPLVVISNTLAIIAFVGNLAKGIGLAKVLYHISIDRGMASDVAIPQAYPSS